MAIHRVVRTHCDGCERPLLPEMPPRDPNAPGQFGLADPEKIRTVLEQSGWASSELAPMDFACTMAEADLERYFTRLGPVGMLTQPARPSVSRARIGST